MIEMEAWRVAVVVVIGWGIGLFCGFVAGLADRTTD